MQDWEDLVPEIAEAYGGSLPHPSTNEQLAAAYLRAPKAVLRASDAVAAEYAEGTVRSPWGMLAHRVKNIQGERETGQKVLSRDKALEKAEQWMRTAGLMFDRQSEIEDELWGDRGLIRDHDTPETRKRMLDLWHETRPKGEQVEREHEAFLERYREQRSKGLA